MSQQLSWWARFAVWIGRTSWFRRLVGPRILTPIDRFLLRHGGRSITAPAGEFPMLNLTAVGARSGEARTVPLIYAPLDDAYVVVGTNWGRTHHPAWAANLISTPDATVTIDGTATAVAAVLLDEAERRAIWPQLVDVMPLWADYDRSITERPIRVFRLEPK